MAYFPPVPPVDTKPLEDKIRRLESESAAAVARITELESKVDAIAVEEPVPVETK